MSTVGLHLARLALGIAWLAMLAALAALIALPHLAPIAGRQLLVMNGDAMAGSVPAGALVSVRRADPATIAAGDVVTFRTEEGTLATRRVVEADPAGASILIDGRTSVLATAVVGVAEAYVPHAGAVLAALSTTLGALLALALVSGLLLAYWLVDDRLSSRPAARGREPSVQPAG